MLIRRRWVDAVVVQARVWILSESAPDSLTLPSATAIQCSPPYTSATWADRVPWAMTLPARSVHLVADSGDEVTLRLGLDLTAPSCYNVRVEVVTPAGTARVGASLRPVFKDLPDLLDAPHETFHLSLPGSVKRALEMKGYSTRLELGPNHAGGSYSHSLTLSSDADSGFTIVVKYFHKLDNHSSTSTSQGLVVVARVTLESSISDDGSDTYQDGPYAVIWSDMERPWKWRLEKKHVVLATPTGASLTLHLGFDLGWQSEYYLHVDIEPGTSDRFKPPETWNLDGIHESVSLTLPGHVKRALQTDGYEVRFEALDVDDEGNPARHRLTLSKADPGFAIVIDYSHNLTTPYAREPPRQDLTFQARVKVLPSSSVQDHTPVAPQTDSTTMDWNARDPDSRMWCPHLPGKDITLVLPTGRRLTLRLGFYLVWYSEYCVTAEILKPRSRLWCKPSRRDLPTVGPITSVEEGALHPVSPQPLHRGWTLLRKVLKVLKGSTIPSDIS